MRKIRHFFVVKSFAQYAYDLTTYGMVIEHENVQYIITEKVENGKNAVWGILPENEDKLVWKGARPSILTAPVYGTDLKLSSICTYYVGGTTASTAAKPSRKHSLILDVTVDADGYQVSVFASVEHRIYRLRGSCCERRDDRYCEVTKRTWNLHVLPAPVKTDRFTKKEGACP